jgi:hypothetical protein
LRSSFFHVSRLSSLLAASRQFPIFPSAFSRHFPKITTIHDRQKRAVAGAMAKKSRDERDILPGMAVVECGNQAKPLDIPRPGKGEGQLTEKVCPFDKKPCIGERCAVYREESGVCAFLLTMKSGTASRKKSDQDDRSSGKFKAHLFD